jgi:hypothetical protein
MGSVGEGPADKIIEAFALLGSTILRRSHQRQRQMNRGAHKGILPASSAVMSGS